MSDAKLIISIVGVAVILLGAGIVTVLKLTVSRDSVQPPRPAVTISTTAPVVERPIATPVQKRTPVLPPELPVTATPPIPPPAPVNATISGSSWITRNNGGSDLMRGMRVCVMPKKIDARPIVSLVSELVPQWEESVTVWEGFAKDEDKSRKEHPEIYKDSPNPVQEDLVRSQNNVQILRRFLQSAPTEMDTLDAYVLLNRRYCTGQHRFDVLVPDAVAETKTNVEGRYALQNVPGGSYYLYAAVETSNILVEWMIPLNVTSNGPIQIDLFNDNAATVQNRNP